MDTKDERPPAYSTTVGDAAVPEHQHVGCFSPSERESTEAISDQNAARAIYDQVPFPNDQKQLVPSNSRAGNFTSYPVVVVQPQTMQFTNLSAHEVFCPTCTILVSTVTETKYRSEAYAWCCLLFWFSSWLCSCIPFAMPGMKETIHYCQRCKTQVGIYRPQIPCATHGCLVFLLLLGMGITTAVIVFKLNS